MKNTYDILTSETHATANSKQFNVSRRHSPRGREFNVLCSLFVQVSSLCVCVWCVWYCPINESMISIFWSAFPRYGHVHTIRHNHSQSGWWRPIRIYMQRAYTNSRNSSRMIPLLGMRIAVAAAQQHCVSFTSNQLVRWIFLRLHSNKRNSDDKTK